MNGFIDIYCERTVAGLFNEPLNAITNIGFFVAAFFAYRLARQKDALDKGTGLLVFLLVAIGAGSSLFHTLANGWSQLADVIPILCFQIAFIYLYGRRVIGFGRTGGLLLLAGFLATVAAFGQLPQGWLNGSISYAPAFLFLLGLGLYHLYSKQRERFVLFYAAVLFAVSLTFRTADMAVCESLPTGVHFIWHLANAGVLYLVFRSLVPQKND